MKGSIRLYVLFLGITILLSLSTDNCVNGSGLKNKDTTVYNRMICENEKLQIGCKEPDKVLNIQRAYYGRYSITPCNKNHIQYTMGCTANNTLSVLKELCQNKASCDIYATNSVFGNPCRNSTNVLEVIYNCYDQTQKTDQYALEEETTTPKSKDISVQTNEIIEEEVFELPGTLPVEPGHFSEKVTQQQGYEHVKCYFADNSIISEHFNFGSDRAATLNQHISIPCSTDIEEKTGTMLFQCGIDGQFSMINSTCVFIKNKWIDSFQKKIDNQSENPTQIIQRINEDLRSDKSQDLLRSEKSIEKVVNLIQDLSVNIHQANPQPDKYVRETLVHTADTLIEKNLEWKRVPKEDRSKSATKLVDVIENIIFQKTEEQVREDQSFSIQTKNIIAEVGSNDELKKELNFPSDINLSNEKVVVNLEHPERSQQFMFIVYKNVNELFTSDDDLVKESSTLKKDNKKIIINSNIISFKMNKKRDEEFLKKVPVELTFQHIQPDDAYIQYEVKPVCSYWNYDKSTYEGGFWSSDGCQVKSTNKTHTVCQCNHLTHFAILMDVYGVHEELSEVHEVILTVITIVCSLISCISIILTLLAFRFLKIIKKNREQSTTKDLTTITTHLCVCLLFSLSLFLAGIMAQKLRLKMFCSSIALLSHYFFLCSFFWMLLEGVQLYIMLVRIFIVDKSPIKRFCLLAYGLPFLIVAASKFADYYQFDSLGYGTANHCWISTYRGFNLTFIIPVSLILAANFLMLIIVVYGMRNAMALRQTKVSQKQEDFLKSLFGFWCIILTLLGTPWILGYLMLDTKTTLIFTYLFTVVNASQGTIVFVFHCLVSKNVREEILKIYRKRKSKLFSSKESGKTSSLLLKSKSRSSSFKAPKKFFDSAKLIDRKGSNCSSNQTSSSTDQSQKRLTRSNRRHGNSIFDYLYQIFCSCFLSHDSCTPQVYQFNKNVKHSQSFSTNSRNFNDTTQSPLRNYTTVTTQNNSFSKTINDEDCITLLQNEPCFNCQNVMCNQSLNKQIISNTTCSEKPTLLQMYLTNEASKNLYNQKYLYGNLRNSGQLQHQQSSIPVASKMNRTSSHLSTCSNSSNNPTQATYLSPISSTYLNNKNFVYVNNCANCQKSSCQIPSMPPPPLPPFSTNLNQFCGVNVQPSNASALRNKDSFLSNKYNGDRLSSARTVENFRLPRVPARKENSLSVKAPVSNLDENQYLQPECNTYSMVESEFQSESQYYCDDRICDVEENSNMYSEVFEDYMEEPSLGMDLGNKQFGGKHYKSSNKLKNPIYKGKLKDLIAMPEEFDNVESVEHSQISDQDLFNMTNTILRSNMKKKKNDLMNLVETKEEHLATPDDDLSELHSDTNLNANSTIVPASSLLNGVFTTADLYALPESFKKTEIKDAVK